MAEIKHSSSFHQWKNRDHVCVSVMYAWVRSHGRSPLSHSVVVTNGDGRSASQGQAGQSPGKSRLKLGEGSPFTWIPEPGGAPVGWKGHQSEGTTS